MLLVKSDDSLIYKVEIDSPRALDSKSPCLLYDLELMCGYDYIDPDWSDIQGWVSPNMFTDGVQSDNVIVYWDESLKDRLEEEGYEIIERLPRIHVRKLEE